MVYVTVCGYEIRLEEEIALTTSVQHYRETARTFREYKSSIEEVSGRSLVTITDFTGDWPEHVDLALVLPQLSGFSPGVLIVPETKIAFIGSFEVIVAYRIDTWQEIWEDVVFRGFWGWERCGDLVLMLGELEFAAWDIHAKRRWTARVEPPWGYKIKDNTVHLNVMGELSTFPLETGPVR